MESKLTKGNAEDVGVMLGACLRSVLLLGGPLKLFGFFIRCYENTPNEYFGQPNKRSIGVGTDDVGNSIQLELILPDKCTGRREEMNQRYFLGSNNDNNLVTRK